MVNELRKGKEKKSFCNVNYKEKKRRLWSEAKAENYSRTQRSSYKEQRENALAPGADEGRGKLRKAAGNCTQVSIRRCPNGETRLRKPQSLHVE